MFGSWPDFINAWSDGCLDFAEFWKWLSNLYFDITKTADIQSIWSAIMKFLEPIYAIVPYVVLALCLTLAFFGQKLMPVLKFLAFFVVGFVLGVYYFPPILSGVISIPPWLCGIILALVVAVLYKFIYIGVIALVVGYCAYTVCYSGFYLRDITEVNVPLVIVSAIIAISAVVISLYLLRYIEMAATAIVGAYLFSFYFRTMIYDYKALPSFSESPWLPAFILTAFISVIAFFVQFKMRKRY